MKTDGKKSAVRKRARLFCALLLTLTFLASYGAALLSLSPQSYDIEAGSVSHYTVHAPFDMVDEATTGALKDKASASAKAVYAINPAAVAGYISGAEAFFDAFGDIRAAAAALLPEDGSVTMAGADWGAVLSDAQQGELCAISDPALDGDMLRAVLSASQQDIKTLEDVVMSKLRTALEAGLAEDGVERVRNTCTREINVMSGISAGLKSAAELAYGAFLGATLSVDEKASAAARDEAAAGIADVMIKKGELIVEKGDTVSASQLALLESAGLVRTDERTAGLDIGLFLYLALAFGAFGVYLRFYRRETFFSVKSMAIISVLTVLGAWLAFLGGKVDALLSPALLVVMLVSLLVREEAALALSALLSVLLGIMAGGSGAALGADSALVAAMTLISGVTAVFALKKTESRGAIIAAGALGGGAAAMVAAAVGLMRGAAFLSILADIGYSMGSAMLSTLLVVGSLSLWETLFDVATPARLNELSNTNHPLLKQLMLEAPGTYQHSIMAAALAEGAAQRVGADPLLARVGAYFHDVGKLRRPLYFMENQKNGENIHDTLPALESAQTIIAHQKDGATLLTKYKLPSAVVRIAAEHHGNSLMAFFYHKAAQGNKTADQKDFRYPGNRPSSKESAIVMLADSCEAAVRSLGDTNRDAVEQMVHRVIAGKMSENDNQMASAPLTIADFSEIERSFIKTFGGLMHDRIEYPDMDEGKQ